MKLVRDCSTLKAISEKANQLQLFAMPELAVVTSQTICPVKEITFKDSTRQPRLLPTSEVVSTSKEKVFYPYWSELCEAISSRLLLPTKTDSLDLDSTLFDGWLSKTVDKSWFSINLHTLRNRSLLPIFSPSLRSLVQESMDSGDTVTKSRKIRLYLGKDQERLIEKWFGVARFCYNKTIEYLRQPGTKADWKAIKTGLLKNLPDWCDEVPYQIKSVAIRDACIAVREAKKKFAKSGSFNEVSFKSRKNPTQSCYIPKSALSIDGIYKTILGKIRYGENLPQDLMDSRLVRRYGRYYLTVPYQEQRIVGENQARVVALDPGVRTFLTMFSEDSFGGIAVDDNLIIQRMCFRLDDLISRMSKASAKKEKSMRVATDRLRRRITNYIDELHHKAARFLCDNFDVILLPTFETSQMVTKAKRRIRSKSVRQMMSFAHYRFKQFLKHKAFETGKMVIDVCEAYTSKTVSWTGEIVNVGSARNIKSNDGRKMDRDVNGARGIFLRAVVDTPLLRKSLNNHFVSES